MKVTIPDNILIFWAYYAGFKSLLRKWHVNRESFFRLLVVVHWLDLTGKDGFDWFSLNDCKKFYKATYNDFPTKLAKITQVNLLERSGGVNHGKYRLTDRALDILADFENVVKSEKRVNKFKILAH